MAVYRPTIKSDIWLGLMTLAFVLLYYWAENSRIVYQPSDHADKVEAANLMKLSMEALEEHRLPSGSVGEPLVYTMLGEKDSPITTDEGRYEDKITTINPNFAASVVEMLNNAKIKKGDKVAVMLTGSLPGANLAVYSAILSLELQPVIITSVSSSWWGANLPDFTWLDMEHVLLEKGVFPFKSAAASIGGSDDLGGLRLSAIGKELIIEAIERNGVTIIDEGSLSGNIQGRLRLFEQNGTLNSYKAVINVGGGIAAIGHRENNSLIANGYVGSLPSRNYPNLGVLHHFNSNGVPIINISDASVIAKKYDLPIGHLPLPEVGKGLMFEKTKYNLTTATIALLLMLAILIIVKFFDRKKFKWREENLDQDSL